MRKQRMKNGSGTNVDSDANTNERLLTKNRTWMVRCLTLLYTECIYFAMLGKLSNSEPVDGGIIVQQFLFKLSCLLSSRCQHPTFFLSLDDWKFTHNYR